MSDAGRTRPRYIAFKVTSARPVPRKEMGKALQRAARHAGLPDGSVKLTRYEYPYGVAWADWRHDRAARDALAALDWYKDGASKAPLQIETLLTSGTIKTVTQRLGILQERGKPPEKRTGPAGKRHKT